MLLRFTTEKKTSGPAPGAWNYNTMKMIYRILLFIFICTSHKSLVAQVIDVATCDSTTRFPITRYAAFLQTTQQVSIDSVLRSQSGFRKAYNNTVLVFNYDPYYYWFRIIVKNTTASSRDLMLLMAPVGMYNGQLFQKANK